MSKTIFITPDTSINEEVKPILVRKLKTESSLNLALDACEQVKVQLRTSAINSPKFSQHITRTIAVEGKTLVIHGAMEKPSLFKRIFS